MPLDGLSWLGFAAAALTTVSFVPQAVKIWRTRSTRDISLGMFLLFSTGVFLWTVYGVYRRDLPMTLSSSISFLIALSILTMKIKYK